MSQVDTQARYEAAEHGEDGEDTPVPMFVYDGPERETTALSGRTYQVRDYLGPKFSRAEAAIIAFALNAVRDGFTLRAVPNENTAGEFFASRTYHGPTE